MTLDTVALQVHNGGRSKSGRQTTDRETRERDRHGKDIDSAASPTHDRSAAGSRRCHRAERSVVTMSMNASLYTQHNDYPPTVTVRSGIFSDGDTVSINFEADGSYVVIFADRDEAVRLLTEALEGVTA